MLIIIVTCWRATTKGRQKIQGKFLPFGEDLIQACAGTGVRCNFGEIQDVSGFCGSFDWKRGVDISSTVPGVSVACPTSCRSTPNWLTPWPPSPPLCVQCAPARQSSLTGPDADADGDCGRICGADRPTPPPAALCATSETRVIGATATATLRASELRY